MFSEQEIPEEFGRYHLLACLGVGGMGAVYLAHDKQLDRQVALKVPQFSADDDPVILQRFLREAHLAARINHPNLCPVYDVGAFAGFHYFTMPYLEGTLLSSLLGPSRTWQPQEAVRLMRKVTLAVKALHEQGIIHRDLKPANIMIRPGGEPILMDFGLALSITHPRLTGVGEPIGTPAYMAPEQVRGEGNNLGPAADVYSLGIILYEMVTGQPPFIGTVLSVFGQTLYAAPPAPSSLRSGLDIDFDYLCVQALAKRPERRFGSAATLVSALNRFLGEPESESNATAVQHPGTALGPNPPRTEVRGGTGSLSPEMARVRCLRCGQLLLVVSDLIGGDVPCPRCRDHQQTLSPSGSPRRRRVSRRLLPITLLGLVAVLGIAGYILIPAKESPSVDPPSRSYTNSLKMRMVFIEHGRFQRGSPLTEKGRSKDDDETLHWVELTRDFWMSAHEVTVAQFREFIQDSQYETDAEREKLMSTWRNNDYGTEDEKPVVEVSWNDAGAFCDWLSKKTGRLHELPTEAEWEYACRAGTTTAFSFGDEPLKMHEYGWTSINAKLPHAVGTARPNAWGLYDMHGNVWEWCRDRYGAYPQEAIVDPLANTPENRYVMRGGSYLRPSKDCRCANRKFESPDAHCGEVGFRVVAR